MDATTLRLADFALRASFESLPADVVHECKRRLIDTFACALGAYGEPVSEMARSMARRYAGSTPSATVWGCDWRTAPEAAAFANGVMLRFLDVSDTYLVKCSGHPSDVISAIVAVAEAARADGRSLINAVTLAYDVYCSFCETIDINAKGWDQPVYGVIASALGAGKLLGLDRDEMCNAVSLALTPNMALEQTRRGDLSVWKGCAGANAARNGVFAAYLAQEGFSGPPQIFEGKSGLCEVVGTFDWQLPHGTAHRISLTSIKCLPICYHGQAAAWAALEARGALPLDRIESIEVETYQRAVNVMGNDPFRWAPKTRETADHSLPYVVSIALLDGKITADAFADERLADPAVLGLMSKVKVRGTEEFSRMYPDAPGARIRIGLRDQAPVVKEVRYPKGHLKNPVTDADIDAKFVEMSRLIIRGNSTRALQRLWNMENETDVSSVVNELVRSEA